MHTERYSEVCPEDVTAWHTHQVQISAGSGRAGSSDGETPGVQVETLSPYSPKDLFLLSFATDTVMTICRNTNKKAPKNRELGSKYKWTDIERDDFWSPELHVVGVAAKSP